MSTLGLAGRKVRLGLASLSCSISFNSLTTRLFLFLYKNCSFVKHVHRLHLYRTVESAMWCNVRRRSASRNSQDS